MACDGRRRARGKEDTDHHSNESGLGEGARGYENGGGVARGCGHEEADGRSRRRRHETLASSDAMKRREESRGAEEQTGTREGRGRKDKSCVLGKKELVEQSWQDAGWGGREEGVAFFVT